MAAERSWSAWMSVWRLLAAARLRADAQVVRLSLPLMRLPSGLAGLTVAHISDLHAGARMGAPQVRCIVSQVNDLRPHIIVITGDIFHHRAADARMCAAELTALRAPLGVYVAMGNHERRLPPAQGEMPFREAGLTVLANAAAQIALDGGALWMVGVDDLIMRRGDLRSALSGVPGDACKILLVHEPDFADVATHFAIDLQLSGHTHGGQVRLPGIGALLLPVLGRKYPMGLYRVGQMWVYTSRGLGVNYPAIRFNCPPEITLFTMLPALEQRVPPGLPVRTAAAAGMPGGCVDDFGQC